MQTQVKLSNISYNTDEFLTHTLNEMKKGGQISYWCYINHIPDNEVTKNHKHLIIFPDKQLDTIELDTIFQEEDPTHEKPLDCKLWTKTTSLYDWYLYVIHDPTYLKIKYAEDIKIHYKESDFISSDADVTHMYL